MKIRAGRLVLCVFLLAQAGWLWAQRDRPLGKDAADFAAQLQTYLMSDPNLTKEEKTEIGQVVPGYLDFYAGLAPDVRESVAEIGRLSYTARLRAYPDLLRFLQTQRIMQQQHSLSQEAWLEALRKMLKRSRPRHFQTLVGRTSDLVQAGCLYKSNAAFWRVTDPDFVFESSPRPAFRFGKTDLRCRAYQDSLCIYATSGVFYPMDDRFEGEGGQAYWDRVGLGIDSCFTRLIRYSVNLRQGRYEAAEAELFNRYLFDRPLRGRFIDRLASGNRALQRNYPRFLSEESGISVENVFPGLDISGPFEQQGNRTNFGSGERQAVLYVREDNLVRARISAGRFILEQDRISAPEARLVMFLESDSLYNPVVSVRFDPKNRILHVGSVEDYGFEVPFIDTYHQLRMDLESIRWHVDRKEVEIGLLDVPGRTGVVSFKSLSLYSRDELGHLMLGTEHNPLYLLASLSKGGRRTELELGEVSDAIRMSPTQVLAMLRNPVAFGFVSYDPLEKKIVLLPGLFHNLDVSAGKADFDGIEFNTGENGIVKAVLRTDSLDIRMSGVTQVLLSGKQNVYLRPSDSIVEIFRNRDFHFNGYLHAGTFNFQVRGGRFYYDDFKIDMADVQQLGLEVDRMEDGEEKRHRVESVMRSLAGTVYIDAPDNKGGRKDYPGYPAFQSLQPAYVYYDDPEIQGGAYTADSFYFKVDPFRMENLNTLDVDSIRFAGTLVSAGIFPDIREHLLVMPDYLLGIRTASPDSGWPAYYGRAVYRGEVTLNKQGLQGDGEFVYLTSSATSSRMTFLPSRMWMQARQFRLEETGAADFSHPLVVGGGVRGTFYKNPVRYEVESVGDSLLHFFAESWLLEGRYAFSPTLSRARGIFCKADEARLASGDFSVRKRSFSADSGAVRIGTERASFLYSSPHRIQTDLDRQQAVFRSLDGRSEVELGMNQYRGTVAEMDWNMQEKTVSMRHGQAISTQRQQALDTLPAGMLYTVSLPGENFVSLRRAQAGLNFNATASVLFYADTLLRFSGVKRVLTADALFVPSGEKIEIDRGGQMRTLYNARLYFGDRERLHSFHSVRGNILSAQQYRASGKFEYKAPGIETQSILFSGIRPIREGYSQASARVTSDSGVLLLNEAFEFIGKIELSARQKYPFFAGSARMTYRCDFSAAGTEDYYEEPFPMNDPVDVSSETSDYDDFEYVSEEDEVAGTEPSETDPAEQEENFREETSAERGRRGKKKGEEEILPGEEAARLRLGNPFLTEGIQFESLIDPDSVLIPVNGKTRSTVGRNLGCGFYTQARSGQPQFLFMDRKISTDMPNLAVSGYLNFSPKDRAYRVLDSMGREALSVSMGTCFVRATGDIDLRLNTYELGVKMFGDMMTDARYGEISARGVGIFDFYLHSDVLEKIAEVINGNSQLESAEPAKRKSLDLYLEQYAGQRERQRIRDEINLTGVIARLPESLRQSLVFSDLTLRWDPDRKAYYSEGKAELLSVGGRAVNKKLTAYICLRKTRRGDVVDIYLEAASYAWFYFSYTNHYMQILSSDEAFNTHVSEMKGRYRKKGRYEFYLSTMSKRNTFMSQIHEGI